MYTYNNEDKQTQKKNKKRIEIFQTKANATSSNINNINNNY